MRSAFILQNRDEKFSARYILGQKLTRLRMALAAKAADQDADFSGDEYHSFIENLSECAPDPDRFIKEMRNVRRAVEDKKASKTPDLSDPALQLLWAATLLRMDRKKVRSNGFAYGNQYADEYRVSVSSTQLWQQITESPYARRTMHQHATYISEELRRNDTRFSWGVPGSGFRYNPDENVINIDFLASLISGLEHAHSVMFREIGRSQLSTMFPEKNMEIRDQIVALKGKQAQAGKLSDKEYKTLRKLALEWEMRKMLWEAAEKCVTNRYTERKGLEKAQDYAYSLNHFLMTNSHFGHAMLDTLRDDQDGGDRAKMKQLALEAKQALEKQIQDMSNEGDGKIPPDMMEMLQAQLRQLDQIIDDQGTPERRFINILNAIELSFFKNNGLFANHSETWKKFGVRPEQVRVTKNEASLVDAFKAANDNQRAGSMPADFNYLMELCGGVNGLESLQPKPRDRWLGKSYYSNITDAYARRRNEIIEHIWDLYIADIAEELLNNLEQQLDQELQNQPGDQGQDGQDNQEGQESQDAQGNQSQDGQQGQQGQQDGQSQGGGQQDQQNQDGQQGQQGQQGEKGQSGEQGSQDAQSQDGQQDQQNQDGQQGQQGQQDQDGQQNDAAGEQGGQNQDYGPDEKPFGEDGQEGKPQQGINDSQDFDASQAGADENSKVDVQNNQGQTEKMPDVDVPSEHPEGQDPGKDADSKGQDADAEGKEASDGKTLEQIKKELEEALKKMQEEMDGQDGQEGEGEGQETDGQSEGDGQDGGEAEGDNPSDGAGDGGKPKTLEEIAMMEWKSYPALLRELKGYVKKTARVLEKIRDMQLEKTIQRSRDLEMLPEGKEMDRLDYEAHQNLIVKKVTGQGLEKEDLHRFQKDEQHQKPTTIDIVLLIDGSGSMTMRGYSNMGRATAMEIALLSSVILYEAAKDVDANVYIALWGNYDPIILAKPGDDERDVERNILKARSGMNCGTNLAPSIKKITKVLAEHKSSQYSGYTHMMVISDGDISDPDQSVEAINALLSTTEYATLEFAILKSEDGAETEMEHVADRVKIGNPSQKIGVHRDGDPNSIPAGIVGLIFQKIRVLKSFAAVPWAKKRKLFQQVNRKFDMK